MTYADQVVAEVTHPVLDQGSIRLIDVLGTDQSIIENARRSYSDGSKKVSADRDFLRYLMRHEHWGPFEFAQVVIEAEMPLYTFGQWVRHRAASLNVFSQRYSEVPEKFQQTSPDAWRLQSKSNKQGSEGFLPPNATPGVDHSVFAGGSAHTHREHQIQGDAYSVYNQRLQAGIAREQARKDLPQSVYTQFRWTSNLRNIFNLLKQRMDGHAQLEVRSYAAVLGEKIIKPLFPLSYEAWTDYEFHGIRLSGVEQEVIAMLVRGSSADAALPQIVNLREREECRAKLVQMGIIPGETAAI